MARALLCWELGAGLGHLARLATFARALLAAGHDVWAALRDLTDAPGVIPAGVRGLPAPYRPLAALSTDDATPRPRGARTYADLLAELTFADAGVLSAHAAAWRNLFDLLRPDLLVFDHSPTALLAARGLRTPSGAPVRRAVVGNGFLVPPAVSPLPPLVAADLAAGTAAAARGPAPAAVPAPTPEPRVLATANEALAALGQPPLARLADLWADVDATLLTTLRPLDPYAAHRPPAAAYCGEIGQLPAGGNLPAWPAARDPGACRVLAYVRPFPALPALLDALRARGAAVLIYAPGLPPGVRARWAGEPTADAPGAVAFADRPLDFAAAVAGCDLAVLNASHATTCAVLLAGKPALLVPTHLEQGLTARAIRRRGAGIDGPAHDPPTLLARLAQLFDPATNRPRPPRPFPPALLTPAADAIAEVLRLAREA